MPPCIRVYAYVNKRRGTGRWHGRADSEHSCVGLVWHRSVMSPGPVVCMRAVRLLGPLGASLCKPLRTESNQTSSSHPPDNTQHPPNHRLHPSTREPRPAAALRSCTPTREGAPFPHPVRLHRSPPAISMDIINSSFAPPPHLLPNRLSPTRNSRSTRLPHLFDC